MGVSTRWGAAAGKAACRRHCHRRPVPACHHACFALSSLCSLQENSSNQSGRSSSSSGSSIGQASHGNGGSASERQEQQVPQRRRMPVTPEIDRRCAGTLGTWCVEYHTQAGVPARTAPRGNKTCSLNCNQAGGGMQCNTGNVLNCGCDLLAWTVPCMQLSSVHSALILQVGVCNALSGLCSCPAGAAAIGGPAPRDMTVVLSMQSCRLASRAPTSAAAKTSHLAWPPGRLHRPRLLLQAGRGSTACTP